uniref:Ribosomal protein S11 n=1 Tax=Pyramimonas parkeae TaxID=36894 RepID=A0A1D8I1U6_9CHLO|nr:ribosomal protein S11 [Pyramimonas parkeae]AOT98946.1 ribosomal protein S11 [Pyramimonas parkeae]
MLYKQIYNYRKNLDLSLQFRKNLSLEVIEQNKKTLNNPEELYKLSNFIFKLDTKNLKVKKWSDTKVPILYVKSTLNNTLFTLTDTNGNVLYRSSCGMHGFKHARKKSHLAAQSVGIDVAKYCRKKRIKEIHLRLEGLGKTKKSSISRFSKKSGVRILTITRIVNISFNGCRARKKRRF